MISGFGNKGEWSEVYAAIKLWTQGFLTGSTILLEEDSSKKWGLKDVEVPSHLPGMRLIAGAGERSVVAKEIEHKWSQDEGNEIGENLLQLIMSAKTTTFTIPKKSKLYKFVELKDGASKPTKSDLIVSVHDPLNSKYYTRGFNVKSQLGARSSLLNASGRTNFKFRLYRAEPDVSQHFRPRRCMPREIHDNALDFSNMDQQFRKNLELIDSNLPNILSWVLVWYYQYGSKLSFCEVAEHLSKENPCNVENSVQYYSVKLKEFLIACGLGLSPGRPWNGSYEADGGYIVITNTGVPLAFYIIDNELKTRLGDYLMEKSYLDTPSRSRHHFGSIIREVETTNLFINLNLQIRLHV